MPSPATVPTHSPRNSRTSIFTSREDGFVFYFQPDTVAPYAAGLLEFSIPYSELEDLLSPTL